MGLISWLLSGCSAPRTQQEEYGNLESISRYIERLMLDGREGGFLIISIQGTDDFIQFTGDAQGVQIDFPIVTKRQASLEQAFMDACRVIGVSVKRSSGTDGSQFLDANINGSVHEVSGKVWTVLSTLYSVSEDTTLAFKEG